MFPQKILTGSWTFWIFSMHKNRLLGLFICLMLNFQTLNCMAQSPSDTSQPKTSSVPLRKDRSPRVAALKSALLPGWGQAYNRSYWKIPVIYVLGGTITYFYIDNSKIYRRNRDLLKENPNSPNANIYRVNRDQFREWRDWNVVMLAALYLVNILDANVDAHLQEFDVGEDLSFSVKPYLYQDFYNSPVTGLSFNLKFKK